MIQITRAGTTFHGSPGDLRALRKQFEDRHFLRLPKIFSPDLLDLILHQIESAPFTAFKHGAVGTDLKLTHPSTEALLYFVTNNPALFSLVQQITGCERIGCFIGRVYRMVPGRKDEDSWHDDNSDYRMLTLSINLSREEYSGGTLEIKEIATGRISDVQNTRLGDAILFRISNRLCHRVAPVTGHLPKTAYAGWFCSQPDYREVLGKEMTQSNQEIRRGGSALAADSAEPAAPATSAAKQS
jgi:2-oxoglutarate-Fe(II)-dependent oxygenase superfamily protein